MKNIYGNNPMNAPRINTDTHFVDESASFKHDGFIDKAYRSCLYGYAALNTIALIPRLDLLHRECINSLKIYNFQ